MSIIGKNEVKIYDKYGKLRIHYTGIPIQTVVHVNKNYMYCMQNAITNPVTVRKAKDNFKPTQLPFKPSPKGLYIYDSGRFLEGKLNSLKI